MPTIEILPLIQTERDRLQRLADRIAQLRAREAETAGQLDQAKDDLYEIFDGLRGPDTYLIYESLEPHLQHRLVREISQVRAFDVDGLHHALRPAEFKQITKLQVDTAMLDQLLRRGELDAEVIERYTTRSPRPRGPLWKPSAGAIHLEPGQLAVVLQDAD